MKLSTRNSLRNSVSTRTSKNPARVSLSISERSRKKRKRLQKALDTNQVLGESDDLIPYPTGEVPGRGDCQLIDLIGQDKATYNAFAVSFLHHFSLDSHVVLMQCFIDVCPGVCDCRWHSQNFILERHNPCCPWGGLRCCKSHTFRLLQSLTLASPTGERAVPMARSIQEQLAHKISPPPIPQEQSQRRQSGEARGCSPSTRCLVPIPITQLSDCCSSSTACQWLRCNVRRYLLSFS